MVKVLVLGATGYIGLPLSASLRRDGHTVYGLVRSDEKARLLAQYEVIPVLGTVEGPEYLETVRTTNIDIVVDASTAKPGENAVLSGLKQIAEERQKQRGPHAARLGLIHLSGTWVHGSSKLPVNDLNPVGIARDAGCPTQPPQLVAWRPEGEQVVLAARDVLDVVVMRPALVYGGPSKLFSLWFEPILEAVNTGSKGDVTLLADASAQPGLIHVDDAVSAIHLTVAKFGLVSSASGNYPVFDIASSSEPLQPILDSASKALGFNGKLVYAGPGDNAFAIAMNTSQRLSSTRLRDLLGWRPSHTSMLEEIETFVQAWKAHQ
jgi:nucleoside-diphosphate-sugar epimerase